MSDPARYTSRAPTDDEAWAEPNTSWRQWAERKGVSHSAVRKAMNRRGWLRDRNRRGRIKRAPCAECHEPRSRSQLAEDRVCHRCRTPQPKAKPKPAPAPEPQAPEPWRADLEWGRKRFYARHPGAEPGADVGNENWTGVPRWGFADMGRAA